MKIGVDYSVKFSGNPSIARMHFKEVDAEKYGPFDYITIGSDGVLRIPLQADGPIPGSTIKMVGIFRAAHAFKFRDMMLAGSVVFGLDGEDIYILTRTARIPLEIEGVAAPAISPTM